MFVDTSSWVVSIRKSDRQLVHMEVKWRNEDPWELTAVYGSPQRAARESLWDILRDISNSVLGPWCAIGDFNAILKSSEKEGSRASKHTSVCQSFQECLIDCGLDDMGFKGCPFTWYRGTLKERLDRAVINYQWLDLKKLPYFISPTLNLIMSLFGCVSSKKLVELWVGVLFCLWLLG